MAMETITPSWSMSLPIKLLNLKYRIQYGFFVMTATVNQSDGDDFLTQTNQIVDMEITN